MEVERERKVNKRSWEEKKALCEQWKVSGKTKREFCRENNISTASFFSWCSKLWSESKKRPANLLPIRLINKESVTSENQMEQTEIEIKFSESVATVRFKLPIKNLVSFIEELSHAVATIR